MNCGTHLGFSPLLVSKWRPMLHSLFCVLVWPYRSSQQFFVPLWVKQVPKKNIFHQVANLVCSCAILASPRKITCSVKLSIIATFFSYLLVFAHPRPILGSLSNDDGDGNENGKKAIGLDWQNNNFACASRFFVPFFPVMARLQREPSNFTFCGGRDNKTTTSFSFS